MCIKLILCSAYFILLFGCGEYTGEKNHLSPQHFIKSVNQANLDCSPVSNRSRPDLLMQLPGHRLAGVYQGNNFTFALFDFTNFDVPEFDDKNGSVLILRNQNLFLCGNGSNADPYIEIFENLKQPITTEQLGFFIYPFGICMLISIFVTCERLFSLRSGLTFPRKVAKALRNGEFPNRQWKKRSSAERIVWVATKEKTSIDSLRSYTRLEISSMGRGLFLLEVVVSAAPLLGLLGTVTGLVQVFSQMPSDGGTGSTSIFSEGIAMALLTTIAGLAIAIPTLISHSYLVRLIEKRATALDWLTERLVDAVYPKKEGNLD